MIIILVNLARAKKALTVELGDTQTVKRDDSSTMFSLGAASA